MSAADSLPVGWRQKTDVKGRHYYCCGNKTQWERPVELALPAGWVRKQDARGRTYYCSKALNQSQWQPPAADESTAVISASSYGRPGSSCSGTEPGIAGRVTVALPPGWGQQVDPKGRTYYCCGQQTQWQRPAAAGGSQDGELLHSSRQDFLEDKLCASGGGDKEAPSRQKGGRSSGTENQAAARASPQQLMPSPRTQALPAAVEAAELSKWIQLAGSDANCQESARMTLDEWLQRKSTQRSTPDEDDQSSSRLSADTAEPAGAPGTVGPMDAGARGDARGNRFSVLQRKPELADAGLLDDDDADDDDDDDDEPVDLEQALDFLGPSPLTAPRADGLSLASSSSRMSATANWGKLRKEHAPRQTMLGAVLKEVLHDEREGASAMMFRTVPSWVSYRRIPQCRYRQVLVIRDPGDEIDGIRSGVKFLGYPGGAGWARNIGSVA